MGEEQCMTDTERVIWQRVSSPDLKNQAIFLEVLMHGGREQVGVLDSIPFDQVTEVLTAIAEKLGKALESAKPTKASVELGVEFGLEGGKLVALIARGSAKANLKIGLEWAATKPELAATKAATP
jgi:hypothetical protein